MSAISRNKIKIWVVPTDTAASGLVTTSGYTSSNTLGYITGQIKNYNKSGGDSDVESDPVFGGFVDKEKPISQYEISFELIPSIELGHIWEEMTYGEDGTGVLSSAAASPSDRAVYIQAYKDATDVQGWGFNNANVTMLDMEHSADDNQTKNMTLKFSPTTDSGVANFIMNSYARDTTFTAITNLPAWTELDNNLV